MIDNHNHNHSYLPKVELGVVVMDVLYFCFVLFVVTMQDRDRIIRQKSGRGFLGGKYS